MALIKPYQLTKDILLPNAYFRIVEIRTILQSDQMRHMPIKVFGYYDKDARMNNSMDYFYEQNFLCDIGDYDAWFNLDNMNGRDHIAQAYEFLKTFDEFKDAIDDIDK